MKSLSIIVPVYNSGAYLEECLNSLVLQDVVDFEVIIVDDNSKAPIMQAISKNHGIGTKSHTVTISLPVDDIVGLDLK